MITFKRSGQGIRSASAAVACIGAVACGDADSLDPGVEHPDLGEQSAAAEDEAEDSWGPAIPVTDVAVAEIELTNGSTLGFYEIAPGVLLVGQSEDYANGPQTDYDPADLENLTPTEFYQKLLPGEALPQTLIDAQARAIDLAARADEPGGIFDVRSQAPKPSDTQYEELNEFSPQIIAPGVGQVKQAAVDDSAYPWSEYKTKIQCQPLDWVVRWNHRTGDTSFTRVDNYLVDVGAGVYRGNVSYRVRVNTWSWSTPVSVSLGAGQGWHFHKFQVGFDFAVESKVTDASGDGYHHCGSGG
jgi:hypothetical protein